ncbi:MAG: Holliday junction branch migration protein RuvA [Bacteroidia bacterium]|nr:Holliday junction branch migration protein RuvA [Bacteroidia bacterium]
MLEYVHGHLTEATPTYAVVDCHGVGYYLNISLSTFAQLQGKTECQLFIHEAIKEDAYSLYGFFTKEERELFRLLILVSGVGANTARVILSAYQPVEIQRAIMTEDVNLIKGIKGIGPKSAQKIIIELKDKVAKLDMQGAGDVGTLFPVATSPIKSEALAALEVLGFKKEAAQKDIDRLIKQNPDITVEQLVKLAIKEFSSMR